MFAFCSHDQEPTAEGQVYTLGLLEQFRTECSELWGASSKPSERVDRLLRQLADPNLDDISARLPFRVELKGSVEPAYSLGHRRLGDVTVGHAALEAAIASYPGERFTLRNGILVIREHIPKF